MALVQKRFGSSSYHFEIFFFLRVSGKCNLCLSQFQARVTPCRGMGEASFPLEVSNTPTVGPADTYKHPTVEV